METTKEKLEEIYYNNSNAQAAKKLNVSVATLLKRIKEAGIKLKGYNHRPKRKKKLTVI